MVIDAAQRHRGADAKAVSRLSTQGHSHHHLYPIRWTAEGRDISIFWHEIEKTLALDTTPMTWPVGAAAIFSAV